MEAGAAVERLPVGLDRLAQVPDLAVGVAERGVEVRELAARRRVGRARDRGLLEPRAELARALVLAALLVDARCSASAASA